MKKMIFGVALSLVAATVFADEAAEESYSPWSFSVGYAWRARAKTSFSAGSEKPSGGSYANGSYNGAQDWTFDGTFDEGKYVDPNYNEPLYSMALENTESIGGGSEENGMHGVTFAAGYSFWGNEVIDLSARLRFAGYWGLKNSASGGYHQYYDNYSFGFPTPSMGIGTPMEGVDSATYEGRTYGIGGASPTMRLRADLYQIGLGPQVTWHAFEGWCRPLSWIDVYGNVEILCNIIDSDLDAGGASSSETNCRIGFGANAGILGNITDWFGVFAQIGYEWIDEDDVKCQGVTAETDYSSLILSAGFVFSF